jgi:hypothetical protein
MKYTLRGMVISSVDSTKEAMASKEEDLEVSQETLLVSGELRDRFEA